MNSSQRGMLSGGIWLVGLGIVFLVQSLTRLPWSEAWPLFIILAGVAMLLSAIVFAPRRGVTFIWGLTWPVAWIVVGAVLLASTTGRLGDEPGALISTWWPAAVIVLGAWFILGSLIRTGSDAPVERLSLPLGGASSASVKLTYGAGILDIARAAPGALVDGSFAGGVVHESRGPGQVELRQDTTYGFPWVDHEGRWSMGLTGEVPLDLRLETGAAKAQVDLAELQVRRLDLQTGASETRVRLPRAAGQTDVHASAGVAALILEVPTGVAAIIRSKMTLGSNRIDEARFPRTIDGYASPDYATAANRVTIDIDGGVGSVQVLGGA